MWPLCKGMPKYKETVVVTLADKYCATAEIIKQIKSKLTKNNFKLKHRLKTKENV